MSDPRPRHAEWLRQLWAGERASLVLADRTASRSLVAIIAILTFLAALAAGGAAIVARGASDWRLSAAREATVQLRPVPGRDIEADLGQAAALARATPGVVEARPLSRGEAEALLEPWLGRGLELSGLPVPRLLILRLGPGGAAALPELGRKLAAGIPGSTLDDHGRWLSRLSGLATAILALALALVAVILVGSGLAVAFATRGAMAGSLDTVEVLHLVGADDRFVSRQFVRRFLRLGIGAAAGGAVAAAFAIAGLGAVAGGGGGEGGPDPELDGLVGGFALDPGGLGLIAAVAVLVAALVGLVSSWTARRFLGQVNGR